jgi:hypothetical protein
VLRNSEALALRQTASVSLRIILGQTARQITSSDKLSEG